MPESNGHSTRYPPSWFRGMASALVSRLSLASSLGVTHQGVRDMEQVLGYKYALTYQDYKRAYLRYDIAQRLVHCYPEDTWRKLPQVHEDDENDTYTAFEAAWDGLAARLKLQTQLGLLDMQANLGHFAVLLLGLRGQTNLTLPASPVRGPDDVLFVQRYSEEFVSVASFGTDPGSPDYGRPLSYRMQTVSTADDHLPRHTPPAFVVHASRVIHVPGEYRLDDDIYGRPVLEAVYNKLVDLLKVVGGAGEMFWTDAKRRIALEVRDGFELQPDQAAALTDEADEFTHGLRSFLRLSGVEAKLLAGSVASPKEHFDVLMQLIAGTRAIPQRILLGTEEGVRAGDQDKDLYSGRVAGRMVNYAETEILRPLIDRLLALKALPQPGQPYLVDWGQGKVLSETERATNAQKWAVAFDTFTKGLAQTVVPLEEFRERVAGWPPLPEVGELLDMTPEEEPMTTPADEASEDDEGDTDAEAAD